MGLIILGHVFILLHLQRSNVTLFISVLLDYGSFSFVDLFFLSLQMSFFMYM